ncbi:MAG: SEC-C domain-containing protein [Gammaproteobacteria bacterium]|nr:SEC-C domain-containing protein [Gammaproteobacteria bacterium]
MNKSAETGILHMCDRVIFKVPCPCPCGSGKKYKKRWLH